VFITEALRKLFGDEDFVTLLRAEAILRHQETLLYASRLKRGVDRAAKCFTDSCHDGI
jgi:hypothetical protein